MSVACKDNRPFPSCHASVSRRVLVQNVSYEKEFDLHEDEHEGEIHFRMNGLHEDLT